MRRCAHLDNGVRCPEPGTVWLNTDVGVVWYCRAHLNLLLGGFGMRETDDD